MSTHNKSFILIISIITSVLFTLCFLLPALFKANQIENVSDYFRAMAVVNGVAFTGLFILITVEIVSLFIDKNASILTVFIIVLIFLSFAFSSDFNTFISPFKNLPPLNDTLIKLFRFLSNVFATYAITIALIHLNTTNPSKIGKKTFILFVILSAISPALALFKYGIYIQICFIFVLYFFSTIRYGFSERLNLFWLFESVIIILLTGMMLLDNLQLYFSDYFYTYGLEGMCAVSIIGFFISIYVNYVIQQSLLVKSNVINEEKLKKLQTSVLKNQINPHFVFNALANVKGTYAEDISKGNKSIDILSSYLRTYLSSDEIYIVPFDKEMEVIENYLALINLKFNEPFNIIYNIDVSDFDIVYFGLQPFVENAIKYSNIRNKEDGQIVISTKEEDDAYVVEVSDNGEGFDTKEIGDNSYGIINTVERFKLLQNASVKIRSKKGEGCTITIRIPKKQ